MLLPPTVTSIDARTQRTDDCVRRIAGLPSQAWVSIVDDRPLSRLRLRRLARRCGLVIERELIAVPTVDAALAVVEDVDDTIALLHAVPGSLVRMLPWSLARWVASERVLLARRP